MGHLPIQNGNNFSQIAHFLGRMVRQAAREVGREILMPQGASGVWRDQMIRVATFDMAKEKPAAHLASLHGVAHEMRHQAKVDRVIGQADPGINHHAT